LADPGDRAETRPALFSPAAPRHELPELVGKINRRAALAA
jgi:hypothetical protein